VTKRTYAGGGGEKERVMRKGEGNGCTSEERN